MIYPQRIIFSELVKIYILWFLFFCGLWFLPIESATRPAGETWHELNRWPATMGAGAPQWSEPMNDAPCGVPVSTRSTPTFGAGQQSSWAAPWHGGLKCLAPPLVSHHRPRFSIPLQCNAMQEPTTSTTGDPAASSVVWTTRTHAPMNVHEPPLAVSLHSRIRCRAIGTRKGARKFAPPVLNRESE